MTKKNSELILATYVYSKKCRLYAVMQHMVDGKRKNTWRSLGLYEGAPEDEIQKVLRKVRREFVNELDSMIDPSIREICNMSVYEYMQFWYSRAKKNLQLNTQRGYRNYIEGRIKDYFECRRDLTVGNLKKIHIEIFYDCLSDDGLSANSIIRYHAIMRKAFNQAYKDEVILSNPFDKVDKPRKKRFIADNYTEKEWKQILEISKNDPIYPAIVLAACMGLRRSEVLGVRWSRINWEDNSIILDTKIAEFDEQGKKALSAVEEMKTESSRRKLYMPPMVIDMLKNKKEKQDLYRAMFKSGYSTDFKDYVCVNQLGELLKPSYVTGHFAALLKKHGMRHIRFHDLRHTFASILINNQVPLINVSNFLGHSDISTTANIYSHLDMKSIKDVSDTITAVFEGTI
ncbi:MAG: site-specific integrase [Clostridia bacterium]|nr:site-specific integrase [Clostridia bacterium]